VSPIQGVRNPPSEEQGKVALKELINIYHDNLVVVKEIEQTAVKYCLEILHKKVPGKSVEVRIPPYAAIQIITGTSHKRGTPPATIEINPRVWIELAIGEITWAKALEDGLVLASGLRADLSPYLPLVTGL